MIRTLAALAFEPKENIRGGTGPARGAEYLAKDEMAGVLGVGRMVLAPGTSIGAHIHPATEELYLILSGRGTGELDGERFPVGPGDLYLCKSTHSHALYNDSEAPMELVTVMTPEAVSR